MLKNAKKCCIFVEIKNNIMAKLYEGPVYLEPIEHVYIHRETGKKYTSVTKVISTIEEEFDTEAVAQAIVNQSDEAKQDRYIGMSKDRIIEYWQEINDEANEYGTNVHEIVERYLLANKWYFPDDEFEEKVIRAYDAMEIDEGTALWPERIMFSEKYELAGTTDVLVDIDDVFFDIGDWKGLPIDTPIFTDSGWKTMGTIEVSDKVYDMDGKLVPVLHTSKVKNKKCYKINFDNNESIVADFEHRWLVSFYRDKKFKDVVMTTEELFLYVKEMNDSGKRWSHKIPKIRTAKPLQNDMINLPIDPYLFGVWLGDGHSCDGKITNMYDEVWGEIERRGYEIGDDVSQGGAGKATTRTIFGLRTKLRELDLLNNKHLPDIFLHASYEQRLLVLQGFMDADGYYNESRKRFVMSTTRDYQARIFNQLVSSLGIKTTVIEYKKKANGVIIDVIDVLFSTDGLNPFLIRHQSGIEYGKQNNRGFKNITTVELVESTPTRCIEVGSDSHTFLYGYNFSITHNTNKEFLYYSPYKKCLLPPFQHLQDCQFTVYTLQLSTYALMYEMETGKKCRQIWIGYFDKKTCTFSKINLMYMRHEAEKLLKLHKYNIELNG
jgi:hypothetical protein